MSKSDLSIIPMQDYLGLDNTCRTNTPSTVGKNWKWRVTNEQLSTKLRDKLRELAMRYGRMGWQW